MWRHASRHPELTCYNEQITIHRRGSLDRSTLEKSFFELLNRHESWRTSFRVVGSKPSQIVNSTSSISIPIDDLSCLPEATRLPAALELASRDARIPFDLEHPPLFRARIARLGTDDYRVFVTAHHLILDGVTVFDRFFSEVTSIYDSIIAGTEVNLPELNIQYADFADWHRQQLTNESISREVNYWRTRLSGAPTQIPWPTGAPRRGDNSYRGAIYPFTVPEELSPKIRAYNQQHSTTVFPVLLAGFLILIHRYISEHDIIIGTVVPGTRKFPEVQHLMGLFQDRIPLRFDMTENPRLSDVLDRVRNVFLDSLRHEDMPFDVVASELQPGHDEPDVFFQTMFSLQPPAAKCAPEWDLTTMDFDSGASRYDLYIEMADRGTAIHGRAQYNCDLFSREAISKLIKDFYSTLELFVTSPDLSLASLTSLSLAPSMARGVSLNIPENSAQGTSPKKQKQTVATIERTPALSLFHLLNPDVLANPYPLFQRLRTEDPVHWDPYLHSWVVTRYADVVTVLHRFSAERTPTPEQLKSIGLSGLAPIAQVMVKQMLFLDAPAHTRLRSLASQAFSPSRVAVLREHIHEVCNRLIDEVLPRGKMDVIADLASPLPAIVTAEMLGVPVQDHQQLKEWSADFAEMLGNFQHNPDHVPRVLRTVREMTSYFRAAIQKLRMQPRPGLVNSLLTAEVQGDRLTEEEVVANCIVTMVGGQETTTNLIGNGILSLLRNPGELQRLRSDYSLIPSAVEELLRYESPSQHTGRLAPYDLELGGKNIRKRQAVIAVMAGGNRDPERFPDPDRLDITRQDNRHLAFGWAAHFCFGAALARIEGQVAFESMLRRLIDLDVDPQPLKWRSNLGLRGLEALPVTFRAVVV
jgi:hypothetical protein